MLRLRLRLLLVVFWAFVAVTLRRLVRGPYHPGWTWRLEVLAMVARWAAARSVGVPFPRVRAALPPAPLPRRLASRVKVEPVQLGTIAGECIRPLARTSDRHTILYLHGGGYVACSPATHRELAGRIAVAAGARCVLPDYRLAPEHPYPAAIDDCVAAYQALLAEGQPSQQLVLAGDSAGGGLCLATLLRLKEAGRPLPAGAILLSPWVDLERSGPTIDAHARYDYVRRELLDELAGQYLQGADARHPHVSPIHAELGGLPPLLIHVGGAEALLWENQQLAARARAAGVDVTLHVGQGMIHVWHGFARFLPQGRRAIRAIGQFARQRFAPR